MHALPLDINLGVERFLTDKKGRKEGIREFHLGAGGCINLGGKLITDVGEYFLKWNNNPLYPDMFKAEEKGLTLLETTQSVRTPNLFGSGISGTFQFLLLSWVSPGRQRPDYWKAFGQALAKLHKVTQACFGLDHNNYIGSLPQNNQPCRTWKEFFVSCRLEPQWKRAFDGGKFDKEDTRAIEKLYSILPDLIPLEKPALLHGDLWSGNLMTDDEGNPCFIDPAVYFGHREMDLAMMKLFGGFSPEGLHVYEEIFPLEAGFFDRIEIHNLYPLLVHVNLFGGGYVHQVKAIIKKFI